MLFAFGFVNSLIIVSVDILHRQTQHRYRLLVERANSLVSCTAICATPLLETKKVGNVTEVW